MFSLSATKSRSSWLDRLRTAKGFPDDGFTDLDNFLQNPNQIPDLHPHPHPHPTPIPADTRLSHPTQNQGKQLFNIVTDVLHDLFNFGDTCTYSSKFKKSARKQVNPRICPCPNNNSNHDNNNAASEKVALLRSGDSNSGVEGAQVLDKLEKQRAEGVERDATLVGFSRTEVTVIDTSYELWKFEKLLYRKKNVWKVRDKKGKSEITRNKKRRKGTGVTGEDRPVAAMMRSKSDKKEGSAGECQLPLCEMNKSDVHEKAPNQVGRIAEQNQTGYSKMEDGSSSVILVKSIHNGKRHNTSLSKGSLKSKQKRT